MDPAAVKYVITSPLSLGRVMWWYGEDGLWTAALLLEPAVVADLAPHLAELRAAPGVLELLWPGAPLADAHLVLGTIAHLEAGLGRRRAGIDAVDRCRKGSRSARTSGGGHHSGYNGTATTWSESS